MTNIILVTSEKGGQGKSVVCKCLADYAMRQNKSLAIFDTDSTNPDVYKAYPERAQLAFFSESEALQDYANSIVEAAVDSDVLVNCRASVFLAMRHWFENNNIFELAAEEGMTFVMTFVTDGEPESLNMLKENLRYFQGKVRFMVLRNLGTARVKDMQLVWRSFDQDSDLQSLLKDCNATVLDFPAMYGNAEMLTIKEQNLSFLKASQDSSFKLVPRKRIGTFLSQAFKVIAQGNFFSIPSSLSPSSVPSVASSAPTSSTALSASSSSSMPTSPASVSPLSSSTYTRTPASASTSMPPANSGVSSPLKSNSMANPSSLPTSNPLKSSDSSTSSTNS